jgi:hypothetical protein
MGTMKMDLQNYKPPPSSFELLILKPQNLLFLNLCESKKTTCSLP